MEMDETERIPDDGYQFTAKRKKGVSKDPNPDSFWIDMPSIIQITKAKEEHPNWGAKKILDELKVAYSERMVKKILSLYFYDGESKSLYRKSQELNVNHRKCLDKESLIEMMRTNHMKDHRKSEAIYDSLRSSVFPVVRENIRILFKLYINCKSCANAIELPKTTIHRRPIPASYPNSRWQIDLKKMPAVRGYGYICNIVDCFSRFAFGGPLKGKQAKDVAELVLRFIYLFGSPRILQSDNGKEFTNSDLAQVVEVFKTQQIHGRPYHPQSQGRVERFNRTLTEYFRREMSLEKDWPSKLHEFYYNYNNRVHKSTKPSTPYQLFFKRPNFAPPAEELPLVLLTEDERKFLSSAHLDVEVNEDEDAEINNNCDRETIQDVTFDEAMDMLDNEEDKDGENTTRTTQSLTNLRTVVEPHITELQSAFLSKDNEDRVQIDPMSGASSYYKQMYKRRFSDPRENKENHIVQNNEPSFNEGLHQYFKRQQLQLYPLEMFSDTQEDLYTPYVGETLKFRTNPAMNKGTAVFTSGFWRDGVFQEIKTDTNRGKIFVIKDSLTNYTFELNRYQLRSCR